MPIPKNLPKAATDAIAASRCLPAPTIDFNVRSMDTGLTFKKGWNSVVLSGAPFVRPDSYGGFISVDFRPNDPKAGGVFVHLPVTLEQPTLESVAQQIAEAVNEKTPYTAQAFKSGKDSFTVLFGYKPKDENEGKSAGSSVQGDDAFTER